MMDRLRNHEFHVCVHMKKNLRSRNKCHGDLRSGVQLAYKKVLSVVLSTHLRSAADTLSIHSEAPK
jgi:hypothetical protein